MDQNVGTKDVLNYIQHARMGGKIANPFDVKMAIAFLLRCGLPSKALVHFIMARAEVFHLRVAESWKRKQQPVSLITVDLIRRQNSRHASTFELRNPWQLWIR